jgi:hypothetical protein
VTVGSSGAPVAIVTGAGRRQGIAAAVVGGLGEEGWDVAGVYLTAYDSRMDWGSDPDGQDDLRDRLDGLGRRYLPVEADVADFDAASHIFDTVEQTLGAVTALVVCHTESVASGLLDTTIEAFDRHYQVNVRGTWLLIKEFGSRCSGPVGAGRIVTLTATRPSAMCPTGSPKRPPTASPRPPPTSWPVAALPPTRSTPALSIPAGWATSTPRRRFSHAAQTLRHDPRRCQPHPLLVLARRRVDELPIDVQQRRVPLDDRLARHARVALIEEDVVVEEELLAGGVANAGAVTRVGDHVPRPSNPHSGSIHRFLSAMHSDGFEDVPQPVRIEENGRERLKFIAGDVAVPPVSGVDTNR